MPVEPPEPDHPLILRNVVMTPHNGAGAVSARIAMAMAAQNALDALDGTLADECIFNFGSLKR